MDTRQQVQKLLAWHGTIPEGRRPGYNGAFDLRPSDVERYVLDLRKIWSECGESALLSCAPFRESLVRQGKTAISDVLGWLDSVEAEANASEECRAWLVNWRKMLTEIADAPLELPFGLTLGSSPRSALLNDFHWWDPPRGPRGPLSNAPLSLRRSDVLERFPSSVDELQNEQANNPWTACYVLNWLLSDKGILPTSKIAPKFSGPKAIPDARDWLDQMARPFEDWRIACYGTEPRTIEETELGDRGKFNRVQKVVTPAIEAAREQMYWPIVPSAYIVEGTIPLDVKKHTRTAMGTISTGAGQCAVFSFLLSRLAQLSDTPSRQKSQSGVPEFVIVDGTRRGTFALRIGENREPVPMSKGAAELLFQLGEHGAADGQLVQRVKDLKAALGSYARYFKAEVDKAEGKNYRKCTSKSLSGRVFWQASREHEL